MIDIYSIIRRQNQEKHNVYCCKCGKGNPIEKWNPIDYDVDRYHGITEVYIWRECPNCKQRMSFSEK